MESDNKISKTRIVTKLTENKYLNIYNVEDSEYGVKGYQFAERRGIDSVAFICHDPKHPSKGFLVNMEYSPPTNEFLFRAFGGSFDKDKSAVEIVIDEVREECGFEVTKDDCHYLGKVFVSTQMNQYCHLFAVDVDSTKQLQRRPENAVEALACPSWRSFTDIMEEDDWKSIVILNKVLFSMSKEKLNRKIK